MSTAKLFLLIFGVLFVREGSGVIWGPEDSPSGVIVPQVFELTADVQLQTQLEDIAKQVTGDTYGYNRLEKRQAEEADISTDTKLTNDSHLHAIVHWTGYPHQNIFILTRKVVDSISIESWLWRSTDYGKTFVNETFKLSGSVIQQYTVSPNSSSLIFMDVIDQKLQITKDYGETFTSVDIPFTPSRVFFQSRFSPNVSDVGTYVLGYDALNETLWVSTDVGHNWVKIGDGVPFNRYYWRRLGIDIERDLSTIYFEQRTSNSNKSMLYFSTYPYTSVQVFDPNIGEIQSESFVMDSEYMFVQKPGSAVNSNITYSSPLWVSYRRERRFKQALFPFLPDVLEHLHYAIVDAREGLVFAAVYHNINTTNLYTSDVTGTRYSLSLKYLSGPPREDWTTPSRPVFDVHLVEGVVGTVIANQKIPSNDFGTTLISHNKGGAWSPLRPPATTANGQPLLCTPPDCSLHLRMESDAENGYQSILSQNTAIGLLMANGNTGRSLASSSSSNRVYLSRDGGFTWSEVEYGRWEFQYLALGSIIVMVKKNSLVDSVKWSCDEGATWRTSSLEEGQPTRIVIIGMRTEIGEKPRLVTIFGLDYFEYINDNFEWLIFTMNFTSVVPTQCEATDYFDWAPTDERPYGDCLLGEIASYERRNSSACCYVDPDYQKPTEITLCSCTIEDYECDFGFERLSINAPCTPVSGYVYPPPAPLDCPEGENYTYSSGYRKIPGDNCIENGVDISSRKTDACPVRLATGSIDFTPKLIQPQVPVTFTLTQTKGSRMSTIYRWDFNDSTPIIEVTGYDSAQVQQHTFSRPGVFLVKLSTSNEAGMFETTAVVSVLDSLVEFSVTYSPEIVEDSVPTGFYIEFSANVVTQYGTKLLRMNGPFELTWDFGDGRILTNSQPTVGHVYRSIGAFNITTSVEATISSVDRVQRKRIRTYEAARSVNITSDGLIQIRNRNFACVQKSVSFQALVTPPAEIPPQTIYQWEVKGPAQGTSDLATLSYNFPIFGAYLITVTGEYISTGSFYGSIPVYAESEVAQVIVTTKPTIRLGTLSMFQLSLLTSEGSPYMGPITVLIETQDGVQLTTWSSVITNANDAVIDMSFSLNQKGSFDITVSAFNDISRVEESIKVTLVDSKEYGAMSIFFDVERLPKGYQDPAWQEQLISSMTDFMATVLNRDPLLFEVEGISTIANAGQTTRQSSDVFLLVDVNIMPAVYNTQEIKRALEAVESMVGIVEDKTFSFSVNGVTVTADHAIDRNNDDIIELPEVASQSNPVIDIVLAVVLVAVAITLIVALTIVIYCCHRRYKQLSVKYSHLEESAGGNLAFNETFENELPSSEEKQKEIEAGVIN